MTTIALLASLLSLSLTSLIIWSNPQRFTNQVLAIVWLVQTAWLGCVYRAMKIGAMESLHDKSTTLEWWFRTNAIIVAFAPAAVWLLKHSIITDERNKAAAIHKTLLILLISIGSAGLCLLPSFIYSDSSGLLHRGAPYYAFACIGLIAYTACLVSAHKQMRLHSGIRRIELQFLVLNLGGGAIVFLTLNAIGNILHNRTFNRVSIVLILAASTLTACALLVHRVFNIKELFLQVSQRIWSSCILCGSIYIAWKTTSHAITEPFGLLISIAIFGPIAVWLDKQSRTWFDLAGERQLAKLRRSAIEIAQSELDRVSLTNRYKQLIRTRFNTHSVRFLSERGNLYQDEGLTLSKERSAFKSLCEIGWATPESLDRRRKNPELDDLKAFLHREKIGAILSIPRGSTRPSMLVAIRKRSDESPYTFREVEQLNNISELIDSIVTRSQLTIQAAMRARIEYLALMSRGLAHDLNNLITPITEYLLHNDAKHQPGTTEREIHDAAQRSIRFISDYVSEALTFSNRLQPRFERVRVQDICESVLTLVCDRATQRTVQLDLNCRYTQSIHADRVLIERMLVNIVSNAIDASSPHQTVLLSTFSLPGDRIQFEVSDNGCGIKAQNISRIFDPYFSTKSAEGEIRGFGIGLTIASNIVLLHDGYINVRSEPGLQTIVSVELPIDRPIASSYASN